VVAAAVLIAALMVAIAMPAFAKGGNKEPKSHYGSNFKYTLSDPKSGNQNTFSNFNSHFNP